MLRRSDDVSTIYLKCGCFLPDNFSIYRGKPLKFANEDNSTFTIQCKGSFGIPSFRLEANGSHVVNFPKTGKFQFTSAANASLKCIIEVLEKETKKEYIQPFLLYGSLGKSAETILAKKKEYEALNQMRKSRVNVTFSPIQQDRDNELEEMNHIRTQRQLFKHFKSSTPFTSIAMGKENSDAGIASEETILRIDNEFVSHDDDGFVFESEDQTIWIEDFDFTDHFVTVYVGDTISFALSGSVPLHAEHIIYGVSETPVLNFESDVLQVSDCSRFTFQVTACGDIKVSCKVYHEMLCRIDVKPNTRRIKPLSMDESGITAVALISEASMSSRTQSAAHSLSSESFYDSDDELSDADDAAAAAAAAAGTTASWIVTTDQSGSFDDSEAQEDDEDDEVDAHHMISIGDHVLHDPFCADPDEIGDLDLADILDAAPLDDFVVYIDEYSFRPDRVDCVAHAMVKFVLDPSYVTCSISCDGEFRHVRLHSYQTTYRHQFHTPGVHEIYNDAQNFICCRVEVHRDDSPSVFTADAATAGTIGAALTAAGDVESATEPSPTQTAAAAAKAAAQLRLFGSFPFKTGDQATPSAPSAASAVVSAAAAPSVTTSAIDGDGDGEGEEALPTVPLGYDRHTTGQAMLTADEEECLQVLQDCLRYDGLEHLSRAAKKRLKYKFRSKLKRLQSQPTPGGDDGGGEGGPDEADETTTTASRPVPSADAAGTSPASPSQPQQSQPSQSQSVATVEAKGPKKRRRKSRSLSVATGGSVDVDHGDIVATAPQVETVAVSDATVSVSVSVSTVDAAPAMVAAFSPERKSAAAVSIVSSPLSDARYAFAVADWTEDLAIVSDSDDSSVASAASSAVLTTAAAAVAVSTPTADATPVTTTTADETVPAVGFDESKEPVDEASDVDTPPPPMTTEAPSAIPAAEPIATVDCSSCSGNDDDDEESEALENLGLLEIDDERWLLSDEDDDSDCNSHGDGGDCDCDGDPSLPPSVPVLPTLSLPSAEPNTGSVAQVATKRGLLLSALGLPALQTSAVAAISTATATAAATAAAAPVVASVDVSTTIDPAAPAAVSVAQWQIQQEFIDLFEQRAADMTRKAQKGLTETLPRGRVVGVFFWDELPLLVAPPSRDVRLPGLPLLAPMTRTEATPAADAAVDEAAPVAVGPESVVDAAASAAAETGGVSDGVTAADVNEAPAAAEAAPVPEVPPVVKLPEAEAAVAVATAARPATPSAAAKGKAKKKPVAKPKKTTAEAASRSHEAAPATVAAAAPVDDVAPPLPAATAAVAPAAAAAAPASTKKSRGDKPQKKPKAQATAASGAVAAAAKVPPVPPSTLTAAPSATATVSSTVAAVPPPPPPAPPAAKAKTPVAATGSKKKLVAAPATTSVAPPITTTVTACVTTTVASCAAPIAVVTPAALTTTTTTTTTAAMAAVAETATRSVGPSLQTRLTSNLRKRGERHKTKSPAAAAAVPAASTVATL